MSPRQLAHPVFEPDDGLVGDASPEFRFVPHRKAEERPVPRSGNGTLLRVDLKLEAPFDERVRLSMTRRPAFSLRT